jgi:hypothetical protein
MPHDQPYLEAEKKIQQALQSGATESTEKMTSGYKNG